MNRLTLIGTLCALVFVPQTARAVNLLMNGTLESPPIVGWNLENSVTGMPGADVSAASSVGFANRQGEITGMAGLWLRSFAGNVGAYANQNQMINGSISQTVAGLVGETYTFKGWSKFEGNYAGGTLDGNLDAASPSGVACMCTPPSPTQTTMTMEFLNSGGSVIGSPVSLDVKTSRIAQSPINFANDNSWYEHTLMGVAPAGTTNVRVRAAGTNMVFNKDPQQSAFYDDFSLRRGGAPTTELLNNADLNTTQGVTEWTLTTSPTSFTGSFQMADFANHTPGGMQGFWLKPFATTEPVGQALISQTVPATAGGNYRLSAYSKWEVNYTGAQSGSPTQNLMEMAFLDSNSAVIGTPVSLELRTAGQVADSMWRQFSLDGTAPTGTVSVRVTAGANMMQNNQAMSQSQSAFFDDLSLELITPGVPGDYNGNNVVDAADYVLWRDGGPLQNEVETIGSVTPEDYTAWRSRFGNTGAAAGNSLAAAVPEPGHALVIGLVLAGAAFAPRRYRAK